jgi:drug/metabolite transporter (DMT)-like permease
MTDTATTVDTARADRAARLSGILWMCVAVAVLTLMDVALKTLSAHYPPVQVAALRGLAALPFVLGWALYRGFGQVWRVRFGLHLLRGVLAVAMLTGFVHAVSLMSLVDAYAVFFAAPLVITALAVPLLGERIEWQRWVAILVGLLGVLALLQPSGSGLTGWGAVAALVAMLCYSLSAIVMRVLGRTDSAVAMSFWFTTLLTLGAGALAWSGWVAVHEAHYAWLVLVGIAGAVGQHCIGEAFRRAPASVVAPFEYTALVWGLGFDFLLWGVLPQPGIITGVTIIIAAGLYLVRRERVHL